MRSNTNKILIVSGLISIIGIVFLYFAYSQIGTLNKKNDDLSTELNSLYTKAVRAESLKNIVSNVGNKGISLDKYFVQAGEEVEFIKEIEQLARSVDLVYTTNSIETQVDDKLESLGRELLHLSLSTQGSWENTRRFIVLLEKIPLDTRFNSMSLRTDIKTVVQKSSVLPTTSTSTPIIRSVWSATIDMVVVKKK